MAARWLQTRVPTTLFEDELRSQLRDDGARTRLSERQGAAV